VCSSDLGKSRREAGERAQIADNIKIWNNSPVMVFDLADGIYAYYVPSEFTRSVLDFMVNKKGKIVIIFLFVFIVTFLGWTMGQPILGPIAIVIALLYALTN
jgi:hypothetical protein